MQADKLSTSAISVFDHCRHKYFISYNLNIREESNAAAIKGNLVHKIFELITHKHLGDIVEDKDVGNVNPILMSEKEIIEFVIQKYPAELSEKDYNDVRAWTKKGLEFNNGQFHPASHEYIISPEKRFSLDINEEWGAFKLNGFMDLIIQVNKNTLEIIDYKTGSLKDFYTGKDINEEYLYKNHQIRLYHYAAHKLFPKYDNIIFTIYYIKHDKPFTIVIDKSELYKVEIFLKRKYEKIIDDQEPPLNITWRCRFCDFSKKEYKDSGMTICEFFRDRVREEGIEKTIGEYKQNYEKI